ncbi:MAG: hypothetical protein AB2764_20400 [Candidatus Thiodiazotropha endolucinida]
MININAAVKQTQDNTGSDARMLAADKTTADTRVTTTDNTHSDACMTATDYTKADTRAAAIDDTSLILDLLQCITSMLM